MNVPTVKGTMKLHQIISTEVGMVKYCDVREFRFYVQNQGCPTPGPPRSSCPYSLIHLGAHLLSRLGLTAHLHVSLGLTAYLLVHPSLTVRPVRYQVNTRVQMSTHPRTCQFEWVIVNMVLAEFVVHKI